MSSYEIVEHSLEGYEPRPDGTGGRHFFRVAVYRGERTKATLPDVFCEFMLHVNEDDEDPMARPLAIIEARVQDAVADPHLSESADCFTPKELRKLKLRKPRSGVVVEQAGKKLVGKKGSVKWVQQTGKPKE